MKLIVGLGNPGEAYTGSRHNAGYVVIDDLKERLNSPAFKLEKKFKAEISETTQGGKRLILAKPQTFMNLSGDSVKALTDYYKINIYDIWVVADELDLPLGTMRVKPDTLTSTHNGIKDIIEKLASPEFIRFRIGIYNQSEMPADEFVLAKFLPREKSFISQVTEKTVDIIINFIKEDRVKAETVDLNE